MLEVKGIGKLYQSNNKYALSEISFGLNPKTILGIVGRSGSGKSTLLKIIAGNIDSDGGELWFLNKKMPKPADLLIKTFEQIAIVNQDFKLPPNHTVGENLRYPLRRLSKEYQIARVQELAESLELTPFLDRITSTLSGGQLQRLAIARALAGDPALLLLDEPFNQLDFATKLGLKRMLLHIMKTGDLSIIIVSHDPSDFLSFADSALVLKEGRTQESGHPEELYLRPKFVYTAKLFGFINVFTAAELAELSLDKDPKTHYSIRPEYITIKNAGYAVIVKDIFVFSHYYIVEVVGFNNKSIFIALHFTDKRPELDAQVNLQVNAKFLHPVIIG
jgi:iron(III) transport system ATP-binding protein